MALDEIRRRLESSDSYKSLQMEREIVDAVLSSGWSATHSCYFRDPFERKTRELDLVASQQWRRADDSRLSLNLAVECKTAKDYHLLFSQAVPNSSDLIALYSEWLGSPLREREQFVNFVMGLGLRIHDKGDLIKSCERLAYPNGSSLVHNLIVPPLKAGVTASAFRETNTKADRDLESSVLWKAMRSLSSAISSFIDHLISVALSDLQVAAEHAWLQNCTLQKEVLSTYDRRVKFIHLFHPVIVIESSLWLVGRNALKKIDWCRVLQSEFGGTAQWVDVVEKSFFKKYVTQLQKHYSTSLLRKGAQMCKS